MSRFVPLRLGGFGSFVAALCRRCNFFSFPLSLLGAGFAGTYIFFFREAHFSLRLFETGCCLFGLDFVLLDADACLLLRRAFGAGFLRRLSFTPAAPTCLLVLALFSVALLAAARWHAVLSRCASILDVQGNFLPHRSQFWHC